MHMWTSSTRETDTSKRLFFVHNCGTKEAPPDRSREDRGNLIPERVDVDLRDALCRFRADAKNRTRLFQSAGVKANIGPGPVLNRASMLIDAAIDGQGIALARTALAAWDLINGRLVRPVDVSLRVANTYWIGCPKAVSNIRKTATFRNWVLAEAAEDIRRLKTLAP